MKRKKYPYNDNGWRIPSSTELNILGRNIQKGVSVEEKAILRYLKSCNNLDNTQLYCRERGYVNTDNLMR